MESADSLQLSCEVKLPSGPIEKLPDSLLAKVFSYLPFADRYQLCFVSSKWSAASRIPWTDVTFLNLNTIPPAMVFPVLDLCPKIETIEAADLTVLLEKKQVVSTNENARTMKLRNVKLALTDFARGDSEPSDHDVLSSFYHHFLRFPKLNELILHNVSFVLALKEDGKASTRKISGIGFNGRLALPDESATSLRRLVLSDSAAGGGDNAINVVPIGMDSLACVYLQGEQQALHLRGLDLPQLRELCVTGVGYAFKQLAKMVAENTFPKLEVFICTSDRCVQPTSLSQLITMGLPLRILVIAGRDELLELQRRALDLQQKHLQLGVALDWGDFPLVQLPITLPPRRRYSADASAANRARMPPLEIFVGGDFTKYVRFTLPSSSDVARFWRIDCPMPEFLAKPEVAEVFKDVFVGKIIGEGPENGLKPWGHPDKTELFFSSEPLLFA